MTMDSFGDQSLHWLLESVPDPLVLVNEDGRIVGVNAAMASLFRYTEEDLSGLMIEDLVPQRMRGDHARWRRERNAVPQDRPMGSGLGIVAMRSDGSEFRADIQLRTRQMPAGQVTLAVIRDLSEATRVPELGDLLRSIRAAARTLVERGDPQTPEHGLASEIWESVERAIEMTMEPTEAPD